jgi:hypothetical protein
MRFSAWKALRLQGVDFRGEDEIALGQAVDFMRPSGDFRLAPRKENVGMVALRLGEISDLVHESERLLEIVNARVM